MSVGFMLKILLTQESMKFLSTLGVSMALSLMLATQALALSPIEETDLTASEEVTIEEVTPEELTTEEEIVAMETSDIMDGKGMMPCGCGYMSGISYDVMVTSQAKVSGISIYGNIYASKAESKKAAVEELNAAYEDAKDSLDRYGKVVRTGLYTYQNWEYTNTFDGSLSFRIDLSDLNTKETVENWMYEEAMDVWSEVKVSDMTAVESSKTHEIKIAMNQKEELYESLLGYDLGERTGLGIWSWADANTYDPDTKMVTVTTTVNVSFGGNNEMIW